MLRPAALGLLGGRDEVADGPLGLVGAPPVPGEGRRGLADLGRRLLDELGDVAVALATSGARLEVVRDVADEDVLERPLLVALDQGDGVAAHEVAALERA